jgi:ATP-dependent helicase/nuclease subunit B
MNNLSFENGTIIFSEPHAQSALIREILRRKPILTGVRILSLDNYLKSKESSTTDASTFFCEVANVCVTLKNDMEVLGNMLDFPQTIQEIADFAMEMTDWKINARDLPADTPKNRDLKHILAKIMDLDNPKKVLVRAFDQILLENDAKSFSIFASDESLLTSTRYDALLKQGAHRIEHEVFNSTKSLRHAGNARIQALGVAQYIANDSIAYSDQMIVTLNPTSDIPVLKANFERCDIPYTILSKSFVMAESDFFKNLLLFMETRDLKYWVSLLESSLVRYPYTHDLVKYVKDFGIAIDQLQKPLNHVAVALTNCKLWGNQEKETYSDMETKAEEARKLVEPLLHEALGCVGLDWKHRVEKSFSLLVSLCAEDTSSTDNLLQIKRILEKCVKNLEFHPKATDFLLYQTDKARERKKASLNGVVITDLAHFHIPAMKRIFVLSANQTNFPQFATYSGLFDENYRTLTPLPDLSKRYAYHMERITELHHLSPKIIFSWTTGNYEGKSGDLSFEIKDICGKATSELWPVAEEYGKAKPEPILALDIAKQLFFKGIELRGSVSSIEKFFRCPYQYFFASGIYLRKKPNAKIEVNVVGTLMHAIFETSVKAYQKDYANLERMEVGSIAKPYFDDLRNIYPMQADQVRMMEARMLNQLMKTLAFLKAMESETSFVPEAAEFRYAHPIKLNTGIELTLIGSIDRFDTTVSHVRVMDYKSSDKSLETKKVLTGQQLQLLTYLWIASQEIEKKAMGAYYISLKQPNTTVSACSLALGKGEVNELGIEEWTLEKQKKSKLKGWTFDDPKTLDYHGRFITSIAEKNQVVSVRTGSAYSFELVIRALEELYNDFGSRLSKGDISRKCVKDACKYCDYKRICQFSRKPIDIKNRTTLSSLMEGAAENEQS